MKVELNAIKMVGCNAVGCSNSFTNKAIFIVYLNWLNYIKNGCKQWGE